MAKFYLTLEVDVDDVSDTDKVAEGIADSVPALIVDISPDFNVGIDNDGQQIAYLGKKDS